MFVPTVTPPRAPPRASTASPTNPSRSLQARADRVTVPGQGSETESNGLDDLGTPTLRLTEAPESLLKRGRFRSIMPKKNTAVDGYQTYLQCRLLPNDTPDNVTVQN